MLQLPPAAQTFWLREAANHKKVVFTCLCCACHYISLVIQHLFLCYLYFCTGATDCCTLRLFVVISDPYVFKWISEPPDWVKSREFVVLGNLETVKLYMPCLYVLESKGDLDTVRRTVCVPTTFAQLPAETGTCWSLKGKQ